MTTNNAAAPAHLREQLERTGMTYDQWLNQQYAVGSQGVQQQNAFYSSDDSRAWESVESDRDRLANYDTERQRDGAVVYRDSDGREAFTDRGNQISVHQPTQDNIAAAVQLAKEKYGDDKPLYITGSDAFKAQVLREAVKQGVYVANPELQKMQEQLRAEIASEHNQGQTYDEIMYGAPREPSRDDLVPHATQKDWEQFYGAGREAMARDTYEEARGAIASRGVDYYEKIGYSPEQAQMQYHHARQSFDLPRDRELESKNQGLQNFAKANDRTIREPKQGEVVEGRVAYAKYSENGRTTLLIADAKHPGEYTRLELSADTARAAKIGDVVTSRGDRESFEITQARQREAQQERRH